MDPLVALPSLRDNILTGPTLGKSRVPEGIPEGVRKLLFVILDMEVACALEPSDLVDKHIQLT